MVTAGAIAFTGAPAQTWKTTGLKNGDVVIVNPTDSVEEGVHVTVLEAPKGQQK